MKKKEKLNLIDQYVEIYRCLFNCKQAVIFAENKEILSTINTLTEESLILKNLIEKMFQEEKMFDDSLLLLKMQLDQTLESTDKKNYYSIEKIQSKLNLIQKELNLQQKST